MRHKASRLLLITVVVAVFLVATPLFLNGTLVGAYLVYRWGATYGRSEAARKLLSTPGGRAFVVASFESDPSDDVRRTVVVALIRSYPEHLDAAVRVLHNDLDPFVRKSCASAIGQAGSTSLPAIPGLIRALDDCCLNVARVAMESLEELTGVTFESEIELEGVYYTLPFICQDDWEQWWAANHDRLAWSESDGRFVVADEKREREMTSEGP